MAIAWTRFNDFGLQLGLKKHDLNADTLKLLLTNGAPVATWTAISQATEIAAGNGYSAGGITLTKSWALVGAVATMAVSLVTLTATGAIGPFGYCILYNTSVGASNNLIAFADLRSINGGSAITMANSETFDFQAFSLTI